MGKEEVDSKEANDALHMLLHCALKDTEYETQKEQFEIVNYYIKQLEQENNNFKEASIINDRIFEAERNKNKELEEENKKYIVKLTDEKYRRVIEAAQKDSVPKSLIKEKIEEYKQMLQKTMEGKLQKYTPSEIIFIIRFLEELLRRGEIR